MKSLLLLFTSYLTDVMSVILLAGQFPANVLLLVAGNCMARHGALLWEGPGQMLNRDGFCSTNIFMSGF